MKHPIEKEIRRQIDFTISDARLHDSLDDLSDESTRGVLNIISENEKLWRTLALDARDALKKLISRYGYEDDHSTPKDWSEWTEARSVVNNLEDRLGTTMVSPDAVLTSMTVKYDRHYPHFGLIGDPVEHEQHTNQQKGLDVYVHVINFDTGEKCFKKLYENKTGLHFKHTGYSPMYLADMTSLALVYPFQVSPIFLDESK